MKNILNKVGAISKPVLFGAALGVATVAVGIGVATNFMSDGPKGSTGRALSHYSADTAQVGYGDNDIYYNDNLSKEALEQQMALNQANSSNDNSLNYLGAAGKGRFAYGQKGNAYENGTIDPMAMNNVAYEGENTLETGMSADMTNAMGKFNNTAAAALSGGAAGKVDADKKKGGKDKAELETSDSAFGTKVNKLNSSGRMGGTVASAKGGGSRNIGQIQGYAGDRSQTAINTPNIGSMPQSNISGIDGAKHGRVGQMGGNGSRGGTRGNGGSGQSFGFDGATMGLLHAQKYSNLGVKTGYNEEAKQFVETAFDGSVEPDTGVEINGSTPITDKAATLEREGSKINGKKSNIGNLMDQITTDSNTVSKAKKGIMSTVMTMIALGIVGIGIVLALKSSWIASWIAPVVAAAFAAVIIGLGMGLIGMYVNQIEHVKTAALADAGAWSHMRWWLPAVIGGLPFLGLLGAAAKEGAAKGFHITTMLQKALIYGGGMALLSGIGGFFGS